MQLVDSHCHLHDSEFYDSRAQTKAYEESIVAGVAMICVGTDVRSSRQAVDFARTHDDVWAIVGIHPHEASSNDSKDIRRLIHDSCDVVVGVGEIGLDYYYDHSPRDIQAERLREQIALAVSFDLPISFHVRDAFDDFWPIFDEFSGVRGVLHSFTDTQKNLDKGLARGLFIGINGISTFTKDKAQQELYRTVPLDRVLLETDAPFLTPKPFRGKMNIPAYVGRVAEHQAVQRGLSPDDVIRTTTINARTVFGVCNEQRIVE